MSGQTKQPKQENEMQDYKAVAAARKFTADMLGQAHPHLVRVSEKSDHLVTAAKNIRIELKKSFPSVKFGVKTSRYSMGNSITVSWTDGPTAGQVNAIIKQYEAGDFDGMTDCYNYREDHAWTDAFGDSKYISSSRELSDELVQKALDYLWEKYCIQAEKITQADFRSGKGYSILVSEGVWSPHWTVEGQVYEFSKKYDCCVGVLIEE
jgi:hypothetical protein